MGLFKSAEEKAAAQAQRAEKKFAATPLGRATTARERGDALFQVALPVDEHSALIVSEIEDLGWRLEHAGYTSIVSGYSSANLDDALSSLSIESQLTGIYLFRRLESEVGVQPDSGHESELSSG